MDYCLSTHQTKRFKTREVKVGNLGVGGANPIRIQSMTTSNTKDVEATVEQCLRLWDAGCEIVRVTVQGIKEAEACEAIKNSLLQKGCDIPLVADIHFFPAAALKVVEFVDKVRINPGNFADKRASFKVIEYSDEEYQQELLRVEEKLAPLIEKCQKYRRAMRIGTNHGSLSDRIMNRYGDTPFGMVESALEYARVCQKYNYHELIFSMKASNPLVMIQAYRLLVQKMLRLGWDYPLHLGVTEAGLGEDGRIKSAVGIGSLLMDGLGDTIRVSLTEDPWCEIDPCKRLVRFAEAKLNQGIRPFKETHRAISAEKRALTFPKNVSMHRDGTVFVTITEGDLQRPDFFRMIGCEMSLGKPKLKATTVDSIALLEQPKERSSFDVLNRLKALGVGIISPHSIPGATKLYTLTQAVHESKLEKMSLPFQISLGEETPYGVIVEHENWDELLNLKPSFIVFAPKDNPLHQTRKFYEWISQHQLQTPLILQFRHPLTYDDIVIQASSEYGALLTDGVAEGLWIDCSIGLEAKRNLSFNILQACRMRASKTEFISCPSCGRTLFDLQEVTKRIQARTAHLPGVKIAIMGCIVNGPGEMADADFGYVGSKPGKIDLYIGKTCVEKDIDFSAADDRLIELIKAHDRWQEPIVSV